MRKISVKRISYSKKVSATAEILCLWKRITEHKGDLDIAARNRKEQKEWGTEVTPVFSSRQQQNWNPWGVLHGFHLWNISNLRPVISPRHRFPAVKWEWKCFFKHALKMILYYPHSSVTVLFSEQFYLKSPCTQPIKKCLLFPFFFFFLKLQAN